MGYELRRQTREEYRALFEIDRLDAEVWLDAGAPIGIC
jgi:hypothetical protein